MIISSPGTAPNQRVRGDCRADIAGARPAIGCRAAGRRRSLMVCSHDGQRSGPDRCSCRITVAIRVRCGERRTRMPGSAIAHDSGTALPLDVRSRSTLPPSAFPRERPRPSARRSPAGWTSPTSSFPAGLAPCSSPARDLPPSTHIAADEHRQTDHEAQDRRHLR